VRRDAYVIVNKGDIGLPYSSDNQSLLKTSTLDDPQWLFRGNVYGAGSGIGKYKYDFDGNERHTIDENGDEEDETQIQTWDYVNPLRPEAPTTLMKEIDYSTSAGSVTRFTQVDINGGTIHRNVYGGGSLASVGPPTIPPTRTETAYKKGTTTRDTEFGGGTIGQGWWSQCIVNIKGTIGTPTGYNEVYGGEVYGASRGEQKLGESFGSVVWTQVNILNGANIQGNVFGGGDNGMVKKDTDVRIGAPTSE